MTMSRPLMCCLAALTLTVSACDSATNDAGPTTIGEDVLADKPIRSGPADDDGLTSTGSQSDTDMTTTTGVRADADLSMSTAASDSDLSTSTAVSDSDLSTSTGPSAAEAAASTASGDDTDVTTSPVAPTEVPEDSDLAEAQLNPVEAKAESEDGLLATTVSVGVYPDYDRVVFALEGEGVPGYSVRYADAAVEDGSGASLDVDGDAVLQVNITGTRYPDEGETYEGGPGTFSPDGTEEVEQVRLLGTFEGRTQAFIGIDDANTPFRVFTLSEPARLVVDVVHQ